uniref:GRIN2-like protein n=1 Tax=Lygus hesperus TaxID=30085 RepID=A0A0A9YNF4_LYGHE
MSDEAAQLQSFVQQIHNKVSIAVAIAVIKSKPDNVTTEEYVRDLQSRVLKEWQKNPVPDIFEDKLVSIHLNKAAQDVAEVLPNSPVVESDDSPVDLASSNVLENLPGCRSPSPIPNEEVIEEHGAYFQSLVRLKFAVETRKTVPFDSVRDFIEGTKSHSGNVKSNIPGFGSPRKSSISQDSGVVSSAANGSKVPNSVSSSLFRSITHSADTEALITKSSQSLLGYVRSAVFSTPFDSYYRWKGSLLEKTCDILARSSMDSQCRTAIGSFLASSLDQIWMIDDVIKSFAVEHQLMILSTLCGVADVCSSALNNVMSKFDEFSETFAANELPSPANVHKVEKTSFPPFRRDSV